jgi:hypothetical protein
MVEGGWGEIVKLYAHVLGGYDDLLKVLFITRACLLLIYPCWAHVGRACLASCAVHCCVG